MAGSTLPYGGVGGNTKKIISKEESWDINEGFQGSAVMPAGTHVKFNGATGELDPIAAVTDMPFGVLSVGCKEVGGDCTVHSPFVMIKRAKASGAGVAVGALLAAKALDAGTEKLTQYAVAVATNWVSAIALSAGADTEDIIVGVLRMPYLKA